MYDLGELYKVSSTDKVKDAERHLKKELEELRNEMEENHMAFQLPTRSISSVPMPRDVEYFKQERQRIITRSKEVSQAKPLKMQSELMVEEMMNAEEFEYAPKGLPMLLHQHFLERMQQLIQCKYSHMLRWKRFCEHSSSIETLYPLYTKRLSQIVTEYNDCVDRAQRLSEAKESMLCGGDGGIMCVKMEDMLIFLRWLVCHLHSLRTVHHYLRILKWIAVQYKAETAPPEKHKDDEEEETQASKMASWYQDDSIGLFQRPKSGGASRPTSATTARTNTPVPQPPPINANLLTTTPLPTSAFTYAAAASGGGLAMDETTLGLPLTVVDYQNLKPHISYLLNLYGINYDLEKIDNSSDEMELYAAIGRKFRTVFMRQEHMKTFKAYDRLEVGQENWGSDSSTHALRKDSNWLPYVKLKPENDPTQQKKWTILRQKRNIDPLLKMQAHFIHVSDSERVQDTLRDHAVAVMNPPTIRASRVQSNRTNYDTTAIWKKIYANPQLYDYDDNADNISLEDYEDAEIEKVDLKKTKKRKDSYDFVQSSQMHGLMDDGDSGQDPATAQGAYLSFLHLRHLRLRDLQRTVLSLFNYFRSMERTLTVRDAGLSMDLGPAKRVSPQNHRAETEHDGTVGGGGGIGDHGYLHNTPADFKKHESEYIEYSEVDNHDDFYSLDEGRVHVLDQRGYYVMYEAAEDDLKNLENDLLLLATHFIEKDKSLRNHSKVGRPSGTDRRRTSMMNQGPGDFDIASYAHQELDRFGVLLDLWSNEAAFMESKRELMDCYIEAYQHVFDRDEKRALAQVITDIMYQRPRFDFDTEYFIRNYRAECINLRLKMSIVKNVLDKQIEEQREYLQKVCREGNDKFGIPLGVIPKQPISINLSRPALRNIYMLEFHPSLCLASRIPEALKYVLQELVYFHRPETAHDTLMIERKMLEIAVKEWDKMGKLGDQFTNNTQKDLFSDVFVDDPWFMSEIAQFQVEQVQNDTAQTKKMGKEKQMQMLQAVGRLLDALTYRHRLMDAVLETTILAQIFKKQAQEMGFNEYHMYIRSVQMESAPFKDDAGKPPPIFMTDVQEDDGSVYKLNVPQTFSLAMSEIDEAVTGRFSFRNRESLLNLLKHGKLENFQIVLKVQIVHKNALISAVLQHDACIPIKEHETLKSGRASPTETKSEKSSQTQLTNYSSRTDTGMGTKMRSSDAGEKLRRLPEAFISIQMEKTPSRDLMLNEFFQKRNSMSPLMRNNAEEMEKLKRGLISDFCYSFNQRMAQHSLRGQLIGYYNSMLRILEDFPEVRKYFMIGDMTDHKNTEGLLPDPRTNKKRPAQLLTTDGKHVLNVFFIPYHLEALVMYKKLDDSQCTRALSHSLVIVSAMHDMLHYLCAHARLGSSHARLGSRKMEFVSADWGGMEGVGADLRELKEQISFLSGPTDPVTVGEFLSLRRDVMFLELDTAIRHCMINTFLSTGNITAMKSIQDNVYHALPHLSNVQRPSIFNCHLSVPEPLEPRDIKAKAWYPWRSFCGRNGPFPLLHWPCYKIEYYIQLCLAGLNEVDRHVANGEILGVTLLMEDVLQTGHQEISLTGDQDEPESVKGSRGPSRAASRVDVHTPASNLARISVPLSLSRTQEPVESYRLLKFFLILWKWLEYIKTDWAKRKFQKEQIDNTMLHREVCKLYKTDILLPVLQNVARRLGQGELYEGIALDTEPLVMPRGASEIEVRSKQLVRLMELLEVNMITELRKKLAKELSLTIAERVREESVNATDLWKKPVMKESFTLTKPHIADTFVTQLMANCQENDDEITFSKEHLNNCFSELARNVMTRERHNYESYSMYYENLLRVHHQLLYQREQEVKQLRGQLNSAQRDIMVEVQTHLAENVYDLLMEVTALRAKVHEMREMSLTQEADITDRVRKQYEDVVHSLFDSTAKLKLRLDEFRHEIHEDVNTEINDTRKEALNEMDEVRNKSEQEAEDELMKRYLEKSDDLRNLQSNNHQLNMGFMKMKAMNGWKQQHFQVKFLKKVGELSKDAESSKKQNIQLEMKAKEEIISLRKQLMAIKTALNRAEREYSDIKKKLEKELKEKQKRLHEEQQQAYNRRHLEQTTKENMNILVRELDDRETRLKLITDEKDKHERLRHIKEEKISKDIDVIKKQLTHERHLKLDAFNRVDDLQTQVYDLESVMINRTQSAISYSPAPTTKTRSSRIHSATQRQSESSRTSTSMWPPPVTWPANRSLTPGPVSAMDQMNNLDGKKIQRPKTVGGRLRSRIADQLLNELDLDKHRIIVQLEELQFESGK
ncbi:uncharacterized protein LOC143085614 isoform X2 [Mytilus galloprovincialis]|uniref:uncharacterized protein LOC143085614 isoform X2 n=1 Tax=Mytilus galloprovincialis TaxID=29158 RepID=UPI003F7B41EA